MAPPAILLIDSDTANWQLQNVSGQSRSRKRRALAKYKRFLKEEQLETAANGMAYCFIGTNKVHPTCSLFIICSGCPQTWEQRANVMNRPHWVTLMDWCFPSAVTLQVHPLHFCSSCFRLFPGKWPHNLRQLFVSCFEFTCDLWPIDLRRPSRVLLVLCYLKCCIFFTSENLKLSHGHEMINLSYV